MLKRYFIYTLLSLSIYTLSYAGINADRVEMLYIRSGSFSMGSLSKIGMFADEDEAPVSEVDIDAFYMSKYEISYAQWKYVYNWAITNGYEFDNRGRAGASYYIIATEGGGNDMGTMDENHPVVGINWYDTEK